MRFHNLTGCTGTVVLCSMIPCIIVNLALPVMNSHTAGSSKLDSVTYQKIVLPLFLNL
jgi:hypothetical protein